MMNSFFCIHNHFNNGTNNPPVQYKILSCTAVTRVPFALLHPPSSIIRIRHSQFTMIFHPRDSISTFKHTANNYQTIAHAHNNQGASRSGASGELTTNCKQTEKDCMYIPICEFNPGQGGG